ncbi:M23 family metallopeptidase [Alkalibacillus almallahensis]|uniref:M23 family metallopeptidase n=1 Tax=Alkalibacillus almallahensis TaxID=1379154 RepID=UPI0014207146|nr:M23 family metallopeptidase [Alkalibacillus almallahensis]NIK11842.1 stage II sporulation protein Q [Alkalibacillus almallahensis]
MKERNMFRESKWKKLTRQRWFYPTLYVTLVAVVLAGVLTFQFVGNDEAERDDEFNWSVEQNDLENQEAQGGDEAAEPVVAESEDLVMPVLLGDDVEVMTPFYDTEASAEEQEDALIFYNNQYYQSQGVDITSQNNESFDVIAALSGTVVSVEEDELLGQTIEIEHDEERSTFYASLSEVSVEEGADVTQGEVIGHSGSNVYSDEDVTKVHFRLLENGEPVNPQFK